MDWSVIGKLVGASAPTLGGLLGGLIPFPGGAILGKIAGNVLANALGVPATPEAVNTAITTGDPAVVQAQLAKAEAEINAEVEKHKADLADRQDARATTVQYVKAGSNLASGSVLVSILVILGFVALSFMAIRPDLAGIADKSVVLYLLGAWQSLATAAVSFWIGSSSGSVDKSSQIASMAAEATAIAKTAAKK